MQAYRLWIIALVLTCCELVESVCMTTGIAESFRMTACMTLAELAMHNHTQFNRRMSFSYHTTLESGRNPPLEISQWIILHIPQ